MKTAKSAFVVWAYPATAAVVLLAASGQVIGQDQQAMGEGGSEIEEITVTAQKREQKLIDVPISISVVSEQELKDLRVIGSEDYLLTIPNLTYHMDNRNWGARIAIRGITGQAGGEFAPNNVMVDGMAYTMSDTAPLLGMRSFDLAAVEVYRGPQGTLGGANSLGGTINLITAKPDLDAVSGRLTIDYGRFDTRFVQGVVNIPLSETFAVRATAHKEDSDGAVTNRGAGGETSFTDNAGARIAARWSPTEKLTVDLSGSYEKQSFGANTALYFDQWSEPNEVSADRAALIELYDAVGEQYKDPRYPFWLEGANNNGGYVWEDVYSFDKFDTTVAALHVSYDLGGHSLDLQYGHFRHQKENQYDMDYTNVAFGLGTLAGETDSDVVEFRLTSDYAGPLNWVAGAVWQSENTTFDDVSYLSELGIAAYVAGDPLEDYVDLPQAYDFLWYAYASAREIDSRALFGNVFYDITDRWHLSAGLRYTRFDAGFGSQCCGALEGGGAIDGASRGEILAELPAISLPSGVLNHYNPRVALNYDITEGATAYIQYATGFRPGYANDSRLVAAGIAGTTADPEKVKNYEVGVKATLFDNKFNVAAAAYYMDYTDLQVYREVEFQPGVLISYTLNAGYGEVKGFELESSLQVLPDFELRAAVGYTDTELGELDFGGGRVISDTPIPGMRPWNTVLTGIYERDVGGGLSALLRADYRWQDGVYNNALAPEDFTQSRYLPAWRTLDLSTGVRGDNWEVRAYIENVLDEEYVTSKCFWCSPVKVFFIPRMYGVRLSYSW